MQISIKNNVILLLIFFTLLPIILLKIVAYPRIQSDLKTVIMQNLEVIGQKQADLVSTWMRERMKDCLVVAGNPFMANSTKITKKDKEYKDFVRYLQMIVAEYGYMGAFVMDDKGLVTVSTIEDNVGRDLSKTDYFQQAIQGRTFITNIIPSKIPLINEFEEEEVGLPTMFISTPLKDKDDAIIGVVSLRIHVATLSNLLLSSMFGETGETYLVNEEGYMLTASRFTENLKKMGAIKKRTALELKLIDPETNEITYGVKQCITGRDGSDAIGYNDYSGIKVLGVWRWLPEYDWGVITEIDRTEAYGAAYNLKNIVMALLLAIAFPILLVAYYVGKRLSVPILELTEITKNMASGDLSTRVDVKKLDRLLVINEISSLATSFNMMAQNLDKKTKETVESEQKYRELFDSLKAGIYQCEPGVEGVFTWVNKACAEMFGYGSPEEMAGTKVRDIYVDQADRKRLVEKLERDGVWKDFVSFCKKKNGKQFYTERTSNLVRDAEGKPVRIEGVIRDITERKKMEAEKQEKSESDQG
jgi:PAS domain S-box-containing protein